jgi:DNA-binding MurR/RpiR family transcriptional regulator
MNHPDTQVLGGTVNARIGKVYMSLSKAHKKAADYVLSNVFRSATMSIDELANAVGISVATANRFARALGFDGYPNSVLNLYAALRPCSPRLTTCVAKSNDQRPAPKLLRVLSTKIWPI